MRALLFGFTLFISVFAIASESDEGTIRQQLTNFLTGASIHSADEHNNFWHPDLIYTSSGGERFGKTHIIESLEQAAQSRSDAAQLPRYSAEAINVKMLADTIALLTFKLQSTDQQGQSHYYNSGVLIKTGQGWQAINWQATKIP